MKRPNVILISLDTLRADHLSCYGYGKPTTPNIDRLAREGTVFRRHYSTGVWTPPGHASMLTGLYVSEHGVWDTRKLAQDIPTVAEVLKKNGYQTAGFINNSQVGALVGLHKGHDVFEEVWKGVESRLIVERVARSIGRRIRGRLGYEDKGAARTNKLFEKWIKGIDRERPFYAFLHFIEPHNPLNPPQPFRDKRLKDVPSRGLDMAKIRKVAHNPLICFIEDLDLRREEVEFLLALYDAEIGYTDSKVGEIISILKDKGLYDDTMIIITADHGEHFGEHGLWSHVASLHDEVLHIPLIIKYPKAHKYVSEVNAYTQLVDIFPTVMEISGVSTKETYGSSGVSLVHDGSNGGKYHEYIYAEWEGRIPYFILERTKDAKKAMIEGFNVKMSMVQDSRYKYVWKSNEVEELYAISNDNPKDQKMIVDEEARVRLRGELFKKMKPAESNDSVTQYAIDKEIERNLKSLGYM